MNKIKTIHKGFLFLVLLCALGACNYLDVVPDNVATIDHAFNLRVQAEKYLFTCYSYRPRNGTPQGNVAMTAGDEAWVELEKAGDLRMGGAYIVRGLQQISDTYYNLWDGENIGVGSTYSAYSNYPLWDGIRHCNTFLENVSDRSKVLDLEEEERVRWLGEVEFLKAYYHFTLLRMYGPIPIMDTEIGIDATEEELSVPRNTTDEVFDYMVNLLDSAAMKLPVRVLDESTELGRVTRPIALALKAKILLYAASPLFNGNTDFSGFVTKEGEPFFNQTYDPNKWVLAAEAAKEAVDAAEAQGAALYTFTDKSYQLTDTTYTLLSITQAVCERWNSEIIWANPEGSHLSNNTDYQRFVMARLELGTDQSEAKAAMAAPLRIAKMFYTKNGVPIEEDRTLDFTDEDALRVATDSERFYIKEGYETARLNFDREPRFYADLTFDGGVWYKKDSPSNSDEDTWVCEAKTGDASGPQSNYSNTTGYFIKKVVDWNQARPTSGATYKRYPWPEMRLAELYLMYAEANNEAYGPSEDVYHYLDLIRERAGIPSVEESWTNYSTNPTKHQTKEGLREIIQQERLIELAFEGNRFWDVRRWKQATELMNQPIKGWNIHGTTAEDYYQIVTIYSPQFVSPRDYFWPIESNELLRNTNLIQNPGW